MLVTLHSGIGMYSSSKSMEPSVDDADEARVDEGDGSSKIE
jgi:hypothetical protein